MQNILLFIDLDDTLFQTKRKNPHGIIPVSHNAKTGRSSYMTEAQELFFELFSHSERVKIIPTTARDLQQYNNCFLSRSPLIDTAIIYFSGVILEKGVEEKQWQQHIKKSFSQLDIPLSKLFTQIEKIIGNNSHFTLDNADDYYLIVRAQIDCPKNIRKNLFSELKTLKTPDYLIHQNNRLFVFVPNFLDKRYAVQYLIEKHQPELTLGVGDSITDLPFMLQCDFRIFPKNAQIEELFNAIN